MTTNHRYDFVDINNARLKAKYFIAIIQIKIDLRIRIEISQIRQENFCIT
ncbi:hypothetical protein [Reichenbachiella agariperforans]|nr:hypothetical protein [Reichenbachiella agariperforans]MBU2914616.1 hypothetical protein [Reichenbachiella agariperforans]